MNEAKMFQFVQGSRDLIGEETCVDGNLGRGKFDDPLTERAQDGDLIRGEDISGFHRPISWVGLFDYTRTSAVHPPATLPPRQPPVAPASSS
jgi:hypothetical protein